MEEHVVSAIITIMRLTQVLLYSKFATWYKHNTIIKVSAYLYLQDAYSGFI